MQTINIDPDNTNPLTLVETQSAATVPAPTTAMDAIQKKHRVKTQTAGFAPKQNTIVQSHDRKRQNSNVSMTVNSPE